MTRRYEAVLFDLLTGLLDSWTLWNAVAGSEEAGRRWRAAYLAVTYRTGRYQPYQELVARAAELVGLPRRLPMELAAGYGKHPSAADVVTTLRKLHEAGMPLGVVTNCSEALGRLAAGRIPVPFSVIVTAERAGDDKPTDAALSACTARVGVAAENCLFVAGSAYDLFGTARRDADVVA